jgi:hypothetical protein
MRLYATSWSNVGHAMIECEFYEDATLCLDLCAAIKSRFGDTLGVLRASRNKSLALAYMGRIPEAIKLIPHEYELPLDLLGRRFGSIMGLRR